MDALRWIWLCCAEGFKGLINGPLLMEGLVAETLSL